MPRAHFITDSDFDDDTPLDIDDLHGQIHPGEPSASHQAKPRRPQSSVNMTPCPQCSGSVVRDPSDPFRARQPCEHCNEVGYVGMPTTREALDDLFYATQRGSLERIGVLCQRQRCGLTVFPSDLDGKFALVEMEA